MGRMKRDGHVREERRREGGRHHLDGLWGAVVVGIFVFTHRSLKSLGCRLSRTLIGLRVRSC